MTSSCEYENETLPKKFRKRETITFPLSSHVQKVALQLKKLNQDYFHSILHMERVKNVKGLGTT